MDFFSSHKSGTCSNSSNILHTQLSLMDMLELANSSKSMAESTEKSLAASKNHSEAERRRRKRINGHLSTLRTLLPNTIRTDKASLLAEVVRRVKELKETNRCTYNTSSAAEHEYIVPSETDELMLYYCDKYFGTIKVTVCCDDRPELMQDVTRALNSVQAKVFRAEMATVGGRTKMVLWVQSPSADENDGSLMLIQGALKIVIDGAVSLGGKRPRLSSY